MTTPAAVGRRSRARLAWAAAALALLATPARVDSAAVGVDFVVIVHAQGPAKSLSAAAVAELFLKKDRAWSDGSTVHPVDLPTKSATRAAFTEVVLHKSVSAIKAYWQQRIFSGRDVPPVERATEEAVVAFVAAEPGAIGYVSPQTSLQGVRILPLTP